MFIPEWVLLLGFFIVLCVINPKLGKFVNKWTTWAFLGVFAVAISPWVGSLALAQHVFKWDKDDWKTQLFTLVGGFGILYLLVFIYVQLSAS